MHIRVWATLVAMAAVSLAGCADVAEDVQDVRSDLVVEAGLASSHPAFGYLTNDALPEAPEPGTIYEDIDGVRVWYKPAYRGFPDAISGLEPTVQAPIPEENRTAGGIAVLGSLAFLGGRTSGPLQVVDISHPDAPRVLSSTPDIPVRDADTILFPDGRLVLITTGGGRNIFASDVTDPENVELLANFETPSGNHNIAVVPGTPIVYNTGMDILDFSDPLNPSAAGTFEGGDGCHDIAFHIDQSQGRSWALCAGYAQTEIWDIADPLAPELVVAIDYPSMDKGLPVVGGQLDDAGVPQDPVARDVPCQQAPNPVTGGSVSTPCSVSGAFPLSFSHLAILNHDATVLIMGDETGGGAQNGCDFYYEGPDGQVMSGPIGNLWFYDITDPREPDLRGHVSPGNSDADGSCTAHFGKVIGDTDYLAMAFYSAGVTLIDFGDLDNPRIVDRWDDGGDIWDVWFHQGYLFTGDMSRGMDVLALS